MEPPSTRSIHILNETGRRIQLQPIRRAVAAALHRHGAEQATVSVLLTDDAAIRDLNKRFRGIDESTDVLSFPSGEKDPLGDIAIAVPYAQNQAEARGVALTQELGYLAIHGTLHLLGYDDETDEDRTAMVLKMNEAAVDAGLKPDEDWHSILHYSEAKR
jgi:probable rRNA maturation factor